MTNSVMFRLHGSVSYAQVYVVKPLLNLIQTGSPDS